MMRPFKIIDREEVFGELFERLESLEWGGTKLKLSDRRVKLFSDVNKSQQPAAFQAEHEEQSVQVTNMPYRRVWSASWIIYFNSTGMKAPASEVNKILTAVEVALSPKPDDPGFPDGRNTLGGLVHKCSIDGTLFKDPGDIDNQGMIVVPIQLLVP